ncbi:MAG: ABC transporter permease, partial [Lactobacillales bacterium]|nr:ABC transporter permease [Lactobacillales bacterium]
SSVHLLGTDEYGRDILSRLIFGARASLLIGLTTTAISAFIGVVLGTAAGFYGGIIDEVISRIMEVFYAFTDILFAIGVMFVLGPGIINLFIALGILGWIGTARLIRAKVLTLKEKEFIKAAQSCGASDFFIIRKHILPNCLSTIIVITTMAIPSAILSEAALSFLGLGVQAPTASWGSMISFAKTYIRMHPTYSIYPGICIILVVLAFNLFGDCLRDALDPKLKI